jgi:hypothetical protein
MYYLLFMYYLLLGTIYYLGTIYLNEYKSLLFMGIIRRVYVDTIILVDHSEWMVQSEFNGWTRLRKSLC